MSLESGFLKAAFVIATEVVLNAFMHFSVPGIAFSANVANWLGMTAGLGAQAGLKAATVAGAPALAF